MTHWASREYNLFTLGSSSKPLFGLANSCSWKGGKHWQLQPALSWNMSVKTFRSSVSCVVGWVDELPFCQARWFLPCPLPTPGVYSNSHPLSRWCHPTISSSVIPFSSCLQSFPASGSFPMSQFFASGGQSIGVSASTSVLPMNIQDWFRLGWTSWISLKSPI